MMRILAAAAVTFGGFMLAARGVIDDNNAVALVGGAFFVAGCLALVYEVRR